MTAVRSAVTKHQFPRHAHLQWNGTAPAQGQGFCGCRLLYFSRNRTSQTHALWTLLESRGRCPPPRSRLFFSSFLAVENPLNDFLFPWVKDFFRLSSCLRAVKCSADNSALLCPCRCGRQVPSQQFYKLCRCNIKNLRRILCLLQKLAGIEKKVLSGSS